MNAVGRLGSYIYRGVGTVSGPFHPFGGAVDIIVVEQPDGTFKSSPWYVRFGKFQGVLKNKRNVIKIDVNDEAAGFDMYLDHRGQAYFLREVDDVVEEGETMMYPLSSGDEADGRYCDVDEVRRPMKSKSCNYDAAGPGAGNGKIVGKPGIFGFVFGRRLVKEEGDNGGSGVERVSSLERAEIAANLLEVKWSTNLDSHVNTREKRSGFLAADVPEKKMANGDMQMNDEERRASVSLLGNAEISVSEINLEEADSSSSCEDESGQGRSLDKCAVPLETLVESCEIPIGIQNDDHFMRKNSISEVVSSLEASPTLRFVDEKEQDYHENIIVLQSGENCGQASASSRVKSAVLCEASGCLVRSDEGSYEATNTILLVASEGNGEIDACSESKSIKMTDQPLAQGALECFVEFEQELLNVPESADYILGNDSTLSSAEEEDLRNIGTSHERSQPSLQVHDSDSNVINGIRHSAGTCEEPQSISFSSLLQSESSEEEQFVFTDLDECKPCGSGSMVSTFPDTIEENGKEICEENEMSGVQPVEKSKIVSDPINIRRNDECASEEGRLVESLPNMRFHSPDLYANHCQPLSQSLDPSSESLKWGFKKDESDSGNSETEKWNAGQLVNDEKDAEDSPDSKAFKHVLANPQVVELSLCKHLLSEGMGAEAASQVFNSKKLDINKFASLGPSIVKNDKLVVRIGGCYFHWDAAAPIILGMVSFGTDKIVEPKGMMAVDQVEKSGNVAPGGGSWKLWPFSLKRSRKDGKFLDSSRDATENEEKQNGLRPKLVKQTVRALTPTSEQLASLNLKDGRNSVTFTFSTNMLGIQQVDARIYLWKWNDRIVISDVDGTITRSDVLGQFMPLVGVDWSQTGVTHLFSAIKENGYHLIFLSARAISQASVTRQFLVNLKQDGKALPDGPVVISPDGLFPSLFREVIRRAPHEFKIACLEEIRALFPQDNNPFYAGFGNRDTDEISYLKVGIPKGKIFIINPKGEVAVNRRVDTRSYTSLHALVNGMFPATTTLEREDFNAWNFWKLPPPLIDV